VHRRLLPADDGAVLLDGREQDIHSPTVARALGIGMVYQHFTVVPGMTVAENLLLARGALPAVIDWKRVRAELREAFMATRRSSSTWTPRRRSCRPARSRSSRSSSSCTCAAPADPGRADLGADAAGGRRGAGRAARRAHAGDCSVVMITHKFREVTAFADDVTVLRRGRWSAAARWPAPTAARWPARWWAAGGHAARAEAADDAAPLQRAARRRARPAPGAAAGARPAPCGRPRRAAVDGLDLEVRAGEIVGIAGVSGNGQRELMEALVGQRAAPAAGAGRRPAYRATRARTGR
jgi:general nucleoside transport system ATP-binding protein